MSALSPFRILPCSPESRWRWFHRHAGVSERLNTSHAHRQWMNDNTHAHSHREILVSVEGDHFYGINGNIVELKAGSIVLFEPNEPHDSFYSPFHPPCRDLWLCFSSHRTALAAEVVIQRQPGEGGSEDAPEVIYRSRRVLAGAFVEAVSESWSRFEKAPRGKGRLEQLKATIAALLYHAEDRFREEFSPQATEANIVIEQIREHVRQHPGDDLSLTTLARLAGYAPNYFHRIFRNQTGEPLHSYVRNVRIEQAKEMLSAGYTVQVVAEKLGFATAAYFSRFFKNATGRPPVHWR